MYNVNIILSPHRRDNRHGARLMRTCHVSRASVRRQKDIIRNVITIICSHDNNVNNNNDTPDIICNFVLCSYFILWVRVHVVHKFLTSICFLI